MSGDCFDPVIESSPRVKTQIKIRYLSNNVAESPKMRNDHWSSLYVHKEQGRKPTPIGNNGTSGPDGEVNSNTLPRRSAYNNSKSCNRSKSLLQSKKTSFQTATSSVGRPSSANSSSMTQIIHINAKHCQQSFNSMSHMRQDGLLCDVTLSVGHIMVPAHKIVLASCSPYFNAMFTNEMVEKNLSAVTLHEIDPVAVSNLVDYAYSGQLHVSEDNVQVLLPAASLLQMHDVQKACSDFLTSQLDPSNCLGIRKFADTHCCTVLLKAANDFALQNFSKVIETEEFLNLTTNEVTDLISNDCLNVSSEDHVYDAVMNWIKYDHSKRENSLFKLLENVRLPLMSRNSLMAKVESASLLRSSNECKDLLIEAMAYHLLPDKRAFIKNLRTTERRPSNVKPFLFAIGGGSLFSIHNECECYNPRTEKWSSMKQMNHRRSRAGVTTNQRKIYIVGGYDGVKDLSSAEIYDPMTNTWSNCVPMGTKRSGLGVSSLNGLVYATGGYDGAACLDSVERYDPLVDNWTSVGVMSTKRRYHRLVTLDGCIYAVGGFDGANYLSSVERFDPRLGKWETVQSTLTRRSSAGVAVNDGKIYVVGGNDGGSCLPTGEFYNPTSNSWQQITPMNCKRGTHELVNVDGTLYAIGGNDGSSSLNSTERYDPITNKWISMPAMSTRRSSIAATVLLCDPNLESTLKVRGGTTVEEFKTEQSIKKQSDI